MQIRGAVETSGTTIPGAVQIRGTAPGLYIRAKTCHAGQHSLGFRTLLSRHVYLDEQWVNAVSGAQKAGWATYAAANPVQKESGRVVTLNQYQWFIKINITRLGLGLPISLNKPSSGARPTVSQPTYSVPTPGFLLIQFVNSDSWTTNPKAYCSVIDHGPVGPAWSQRKSYARRAVVLPGIPGVGYPAPLLIPRPFSTSLTTSALIRLSIYEDT